MKKDHFKHADKDEALEDFVRALKEIVQIAIDNPEDEHDSCHIAWNALHSWNCED